MDWLDDDVESTATSRYVHSVQANAKQWPIIAVLALSGVGVIVALVCWLSDRPVLAGIAYGVLLLGGCGLLGYRRYDAILATRSAGGSGVTLIQPVEKMAIVTLVVACLATGAVVAVAASRVVL